MRTLAATHNQASPAQEIAITLHGNRIRGWYEVKDDHVVVTCGYGSQRARRGGISDEQLAAIVLKEIATIRLTN